MYDEVDHFHNAELADVTPLERKSKAREIAVLPVGVDGLDELYEDADLDKEAEDPYLIDGMCLCHVFKCFKI